MSDQGRVASCPYCGDTGYIWRGTGVLAYGDYGPEQMAQEPCGCPATIWEDAPDPPTSGRVSSCPACATDAPEDDDECSCKDECNSEWCTGGLTVVQFVPIKEADDDW